ncbi:Uncharacterised protein g6421 [Pycnogonum litorale]
MDSKTKDVVVVVGEPKRSIIYRFVTNITVEPMIFFYALGWSILGISTINLLETKICFLDKNYGDEICNGFLTNDSLKPYKKEIQKYMANYSTIIQYIQDIPALLWCLVIGEWSDKHGRKIPMLVVILMKALSSVGFLITASFHYIPTYACVLSYIPTSLFGGFFFTLSLSYIGDVTTKETRTSRIALCSGFSFIGYPLGTLIGGPIYKHFSFTGIYITSICSLGVSFVYALIRLKETRGQNAPKFKIFKDLFRISNFLLGMKTVFKKRDGNKRKYLYLCFVILGLNNAYLIGAEAIQYQYSQLLFTWNVSDYTVFSAVAQFFNKFVNILVTPTLSSRLHFTESSIGIIGVMSALSAMIIKVLATNVPMFYTSELLHGLHFMSTAAVRSILSKLVESDELGKAYGVASAFEVFGSLLFAPANQQIYKATLSFFPAFPFVLAGVIMSPNLSIFLWMDIDGRKKRIKEGKRTKIADQILGRDQENKIQLTSLKIKPTIDE